MMPTTLVPTRIDVTERDLAEGRKNDCESCPAALAINRHLRDGYHAHVAYRYIEIRGGEMRHWADLRTPKEITWTLRAIDWGNRVQPFSFVLDIPAGVYRG